MGQEPGESRSPAAPPCLCTPGLTQSSETNTHMHMHTFKWREPESYWENNLWDNFTAAWYCIYRTAIDYHYTLTDRFLKKALFAPLPAATQMIWMLHCTR